MGFTDTGVIARASDYGGEENDKVAAKLSLAPSVSSWPGPSSQMTQNPTMHPVSGTGHAVCVEDWMSPIHRKNLESNTGYEWRAWICDRFYSSGARVTGTVTRCPM